GALGRGSPGTYRRFSPSHYRTCNRKTGGAAPYGRLPFRAPLRGAPDSSPAWSPGLPPEVLVTAAPLDLDSAAATSLADKAYVAIRDRLIMLDIRPGEPIDDSELARELGVGRTPVREALKRLEGDRLGVSYPPRGRGAT